VEKGRRSLAMQSIGCELMNDQVVRLCKKVKELADELNLLTAGGHSNTVYAVMVRMRLAAMAAELETADLMERLQTSEISQIWDGLFNR